jgi:DNA-binding MarR family transcriptional regulator
MAHRNVSPLEVGQAYLELYHRVHRLLDQTMSSAGLSLTRTRLLTRIDEGEPMNQATLAGLLGLAPRSVTDAIDALESNGLVTRIEDEHDRRARIVALTPAGRQASVAARAARLTVMNKIFGGLSDTERASLAAFLATISAHLPSGDNSCVE